MSGVWRVDDKLLAKMEELADVAPAHNPMYAKAMRQLRVSFPDIPLVAALETAFHDTIPLANRCYAVPYEWKDEYEICRWGFHGASHRYLATRMEQLLREFPPYHRGAEELQTGRINDAPPPPAPPRIRGGELRIITCHLGGSNSLCAIRGGKSVANSLGMTPQTGLPHNNRVGDFDPFALPVLMRATGKSLEELLSDLSSKSGLFGLSGLSGDVRDLEEAAAKGHERARLALDVFISSIRQYLGAYLAVLGGADAIVFSGGIGENCKVVRSGVCREMEWAGIVLDESLNHAAKGEMKISSRDSKVEIWVVPTNEEIVVARQAAEVIRGS